MLNNLMTIISNSNTIILARNDIENEKCKHKNKCKSGIVFKKS